jgi:hypothetical protein
VDQFSQDAMLVHEFAGCPNFKDFPVLHDRNPVIIFDNIQAMHNREQCAFAPPFIFQQLLYSRVRIIFR